MSDESLATTLIMSWANPCLFQWFLVQCWLFRSLGILPGGCPGLTRCDTSVLGALRAISHSSVLLRKQGHSSILSASKACSGSPTQRTRGEGLGVRGKQLRNPRLAPSAHSTDAGSISHGSYRCLFQLSCVYFCFTSSSVIANGNSTSPASACHCCCSNRDATSAEHAMLATKSWCGRCCRYSGSLGGWLR